MDVHGPQLAGATSPSLHRDGIEVILGQMHTPDAFEQRNAFLELLLHATGVREREQARRREKPTESKRAEMTAEALARMRQDNGSATDNKLQLSLPPSPLPLRKRRGTCINRGGCGDVGVLSCAVVGRWGRADLEVEAA